VAEKGYRAALAAEPRHAGANHHLGVLLVQADRWRKVSHLQRWRSMREPLYYFSLAKGLLAAGNPAEGERF
jgi:hypothetical protein